MSQVIELLPGSRVYISTILFNQLERDENLKGSLLVRRLVHAIFPDELMLAMSSCLGKGNLSSHQALDQNKIDTIRGQSCLSFFLCNKFYFSNVLA